MNPNVYDEEERNLDHFESEIDELIAEVIRKTKNQESLQQEIELNQKKLDEMKSKSGYSLSSRAYEKFKLQSIAENDSETEYSTNSSTEPANYTKLTLSEISGLIKTATDINNQDANVDIEFIKNFFQSEINNCIQNCDNDIDLQESLNKMLQDFLNCLQTNLNEIKMNKLNNKTYHKMEISKSPHKLHNCSNNTSNSGNKYGKTDYNELSSGKMVSEEKCWTKQQPLVNDLDPDAQEKEVEILFQNIYRSHALTHVFWDDQEEEEIDEEKEKNQQVKVYSTWSENILNEKNAKQPKKLKCEFIPKQIVPTASSTKTSTNISKNRNPKITDEESNKKSFLKSKSKSSTQSSSYDINKNFRNTISFTNSKVNFPLQGGNNKTQSKFNRSFSNRLSDVYSSKQSSSTLSNKNSSTRKNNNHHHYYQHHHHHKEHNSNNSSPSSSRKTSATASVTNISEILQEITTGKSFDANSMMLPSQLNHRTANNNMIKKFIHKIKTIV